MQAISYLLLAFVASVANLYHHCCSVLGLFLPVNHPSGRYRVANACGPSQQAVPIIFQKLKYEVFESIH